MAAILTDKFRVVLAEKFKDAIALKEIPGISGVSALPASSLAEVWCFLQKQLVGQILTVLQPT